MQQHDRITVCSVVFFKSLFIYWPLNTYIALLRVFGSATRLVLDEAKSN